MTTTHVPTEELTVQVTSLISDQGTVVVFEGEDVETGEIVTFAADHRPGQDIAHGLAFSEEPPTVSVPFWAIVGVAR